MQSAASEDDGPGAAVVQFARRNDKLARASSKLRLRRAWCSRDPPVTGSSAIIQRRNATNPSRTIANMPTGAEVVALRATSHIWSGQVCRKVPPGPKTHTGTPACVALESRSADFSPLGTAALKEPNGPPRSLRNSSQPVLLSMPRRAVWQDKSQSRPAWVRSLFGTLLCPNIAQTSTEDSLILTTFSSQRFTFVVSV